MLIAVTDSRVVHPLRRGLITDLRDERRASRIGHTSETVDAAIDEREMMLDPHA